VPGGIGETRHRRAGDARLSAPADLRGGDGAGGGSRPRAAPGDARNGVEGRVPESEEGQPMRTSSVTRKLAESLLVVVLAGACASEDAERAPGSLSSLGDMLVGRSQHTATLLPGGRVLIAGGGSPEQAQGSVEMYDPAAAVSVRGPDLVRPRAGHT